MMPWTAVLPFGQLQRTNQTVPTTIVSEEDKNNENPIGAIDDL
jgi:hypothetical protein